MGEDDNVCVACGSSFDSEEELEEHDCDGE